MLFFISIITLFSLVLNQSESARILAIFPVPSISHQVVFRPITEELARRGHEVTVITTDPAFPKGRTPTNLSEIDVHDISYDLWKSVFIEPAQGKMDDVVLTLKLIYDAIAAIVDAQFQDENVQKIIKDKNKKFDLLLAEAIVRPALVFSHIYKIPVIQISSFGGALDNYENIGAPVHPILYPAITRQRLHNLTLVEKITEIYNDFQLKMVYRNLEEVENQILRKHFGDDVPPVTELNNNVDMLFLNINPIFEGIRPVPPSVVYMGGLHQKPNKELPAELKSYLESSKNGVIYVSFGTNVDPTQFPADRIEVLVKTLSQLPYDILWKWNADVLPGRTDNIRIAKWLPQSDLLRHPKVKLFINQAGLQSTDEAISAGVPLIAFPMFGDQSYNAERYEFLRIGKKLNLETLTVQHFTNTIKTVIGDGSYRKNIEMLRNVMFDQPQSPLERAIWWTEYVLRHGGARHLRGPAANMSWAEYLELELVFTLLLGLLAVISVLLIGLRFLYKIVFGNTVTTTTKAKKSKRS
uniref:UDP-glycosyltransferase 33F5 n=1 Tax=Spodoptera exigua TaxID=7107 RepID=A0A191T1K4_SPOEX|nr:UDP-glycosyltransferase 33F5 [Spodoptera exigua]